MLIILSYRSKMLRPLEIYTINCLISRKFGEILHECVPGIPVRAVVVDAESDVGGARDRQLARTTSLLVDIFKPDEIARRIVDVLADRQSFAAIRASAC